MSAAATMVMTITLVIFAILFMLFTLTHLSINSVKDTVDISAYFKPGVGEDQILGIANSLRQEDTVKEVEYISAKQGFEQFKQRHQNDPTIIQSLNELDSNPIPPAIHVKAQTLEDYPAIAEKLQGSQYSTQIDKVNYDDNRVVIDRLSKILKYIVTGGLVLVVIFSIIAILVIYNTLTLTFYNRREEIEIMRLVGATNSYIRGPFMVETLLYGLFSTLLTAILLVPIFVSVVPAFLRYLYPGLDLGSTLVPTIPVSYGQVFNYWFLLIILFFASVILSTFSTYLAIRKYIKI